MSEEISKNTIIILVILTVTISLLGTWTVINEVNKLKIEQPEPKHDNKAEVRFTIIEPPEPTQSTKAGKVTLTKVQ